MVDLLPPSLRAALPGAERASPSPVPFRLVSNGEHSPQPQSVALAEAAARLAERAGASAKRLGQTTADFLRGPQGFAGAFAAMNEAFGEAFRVGAVELDDPDAAEARADGLRGQFVFDDQVHFLREDADPVLFEPLTGMIGIAADLLDLPRGADTDLERIRFAHFLKEVYLDSDTKVSLLSGAPAENPDGAMLTNDMMIAAREAVNTAVGGRRLLSHCVIAPGHPGWLEEIDRVHADLKPDGWKGYSVGEPFGPAKLRYRLDDEAVMYPAYDRLVRAGVRQLCIHKGILPEGHEDFMPGALPYADVSDVGPAARDWPELNFVIYHAGFKTVPQPTEAELARFEATGHIDWVTQLARVPEEYGVTNVFADIAASFAFTVLTHPRLCAGMIGTLRAGLGDAHVFWGTDSVWYGSPQWQIEAFRRLEMPEDLGERFGWTPLGGPTDAFKASVLGLNAVPFYGLDPKDYARGAELDDLAVIQADYLARGGQRSNLAFGYDARSE